MIYYQRISYNINGSYSGEGVISDISELNFRIIPEYVISIRIQGIVTQETGNFINDEYIYKIGKIVSKEEIKNKFGENSPKYKNLLKENAEKALLTRENEVYPYKNGKCPIKFINENNIDERGYLHGKIGQVLSSPTTFVRFEYEENNLMKMREIQIDDPNIENIKLPQNVRKAILFKFTDKKIENKKIYYFGEFYAPKRIINEFPYSTLIQKAEKHNGLWMIDAKHFRTISHPIQEITFLNPVFINKDGYYRPYEDKSYINLEWGKYEIWSRNHLYEK